MSTSPNTLHLELPSQIVHQPIELARRTILAPSGLDEDRIARVLGNVMGHSVDYADLYFQLVREESWSLDRKKILDDHKAGTLDADVAKRVAITQSRSVRIR